MFIRTFFVVQRFLGYGAVFLYLVVNHVNRPWWQGLIGVLACAYATSEYWKRPDESPRVMRRGIWVEVLTVALWTLSVHNGGVLILLVSPVARAGVHLDWRDSASLTTCSAVCVFVGWQTRSVEAWFAWVEFAVILGTSGYSFVLGELIRQRDGLRRAVQVTAFEREQRIKDEERLRMAGQLHDTLGQHWTAVIRALDVAEQVTGEQKQLFLSKARSTAMDGLSAMREATHTWNAGRQSPREWLQYAEDSLTRLQDGVGLDIRFRPTEIEWSRFENRNHVAEIVARTLIEGATNAIRHGAARRLAVTLQSDQEEIRAIMRDDGGGLKGLQNGKNGGMGITMLRSIAIEAGGSLNLESLPGHGTALVLRIPYTW